MEIGVTGDKENGKKRGLSIIPPHLIAIFIRGNQVRALPIWRFL